MCCSLIFLLMTQFVLLTRPLPNLTLTSLTFMKELRQPWPSTIPVYLLVTASWSLLSTYAANVANKDYSGVSALGFNPFVDDKGEESITAKTSPIPLATQKVHYSCWPHYKMWQDILALSPNSFNIENWGAIDRTDMILRDTGEDYLKGETWLYKMKSEHQQGMFRIFVANKMLRASTHQTH